MEPQASEAEEPAPPAEEVSAPTEAPGLEAPEAEEANKEDPPEAEEVKKDEPPLFELPEEKYLVTLAVMEDHFGRSCPRGKKGGGKGGKGCRTAEEWRAKIKMQNKQGYDKVLEGEQQKCRQLFQEWWDRLDPRLRHQPGAELRFIYNNSRSANQQPRDVCLLYTSPSPRDATLSRMPSSA